MPTHRVTKYRCSWCIKLHKVFAQKAWQFFGNIVIHSPVLPLFLCSIQIKPSTWLNLFWLHFYQLHLIHCNMTEHLIKKYPEHINCPAMWSQRIQCFFQSSNYLPSLHIPILLLIMFFGFNLPHASNYNKFYWDVMITD